jgi:hypothetical protein
MYIHISPEYINKSQRTANDVDDRNELGLEDGIIVPRLPQ